MTLRGIFIVVVIVTVIVGFFEPVGIVGSAETDYWADHHAQTDAMWCDKATYEAYKKMMGRSYNGIKYQSFYFVDGNFDLITGGSMAVAKTFYICSHGRMNPFNENYFALKNGQSIYGWQIPNLRNAHSGGQMLFAFGAACRSGEETSGYNLWQGFINQGSLSYIGWIGNVNAYCNYLFTSSFYYYAAVLHYSVGDSGHQAYLNNRWCLGSVTPMYWGNYAQRITT